MRTTYSALALTNVTMTTAKLWRQLTMVFVWLTLLDTYVALA